jgi:acetyl-CoA hydrolase
VINRLTILSLLF